IGIFACQHASFEGLGASRSHASPPYTHDGLSANHSIREGANSRWRGRGSCQVRRSFKAVASHRGAQVLNVMGGCKVDLCGSSWLAALATKQRPDYTRATPLLSRDCERPVDYEVESDGDDRIVRVAQRVAADGSLATRWTALPQRNAMKAGPPGGVAAGR